MSHCGRDGVYDAATPMVVSVGHEGDREQIELHTLRGRLIAGVQQKAQRGDLALALPAGLLRQDDGVVVKDPTGPCSMRLAWSPDISRAALCQSSGAPVIATRVYACPSPSQLRNGVAHSTVGGGDCNLRNPAYAGTFAVWQNAEPGATGRWRPQQRQRPLSSGR